MDFKVTETWPDKILSTAKMAGAKAQSDVPPKVIGYFGGYCIEEYFRGGEGGILRLWKKIEKMEKVWGIIYC